MLRTMFENNKAALAFAGITIVGAALMIGPGDGGGALDKTIARYTEEPEAPAPAAQEIAEEQSEPDEAFDQASGWASSENAFGDYQPEGEEETVFEDANPASAESSAEPAALTPPGGADNLGGFDPRLDQGQARSTKRRRTSVIVSNAEGASGPVEVGLAPGKGQNVSFSENLKLKFE